MKITSACLQEKTTGNNFEMMEYTVNDQTLRYEAQDSRAWGADKVLLHYAIDLTAGIAAIDQGFTIEKLFPDPDYAAFRETVHELVRVLWREARINIPDDFKLEQYHNKVTDAETHLAALEKTKLLSVERFPGGISSLEQRISEICKVPLKAYNPFDRQSIFHFRVVRPNRGDNNPLHRDVWLEDFESCINLYIPVAGSNRNSSLIIVPESHHWPESKVERTLNGAIINGVKFNVPALTAIRGKYTVVRPDPKENEVLVFSPYLIHGGSVNLNADQTRVSIEVRLWRK